MVRKEKDKCRRFEKGLKTSIRPLVVALCHKKYKKVMDAARRLEAEKAETTEIKERPIIMRRGASSAPIQQQQYSGVKRTRDDVV